MTAGGARASKIAVPEAIRARAGMKRIDYEGAFSVTADPVDHRSAEQWARAMYEAPPTAERLFVWFGWKGCTARLGPYPSSDYVLGYRIGVNEGNYISFSVEWALGLACELALHLGPSTAVLATFVEFKRPAAKIVWPLAVPVHERIVPRWLLRAARAGTTTAVEDR